MLKGATVLTPREDGRLIEAKPIYVHLLHPVAQAIKNEFLPDGMVATESVTTACIVLIVLLITRHQVVINAVIKALETKDGTLVVTLICMVENYV